MLINKVWSEKHRPFNLDEYIFNENLSRSDIERWLDNGIFPHLFLEGTPGTGKTSLALMLKELFNIDDYDFKIFNAAANNGVDFIRNEIIPFATSGANGKFKVVVFNEVGKLTDNAQNPLLDLMEGNINPDVTEDNPVRFIFTCNNSSRIDPALKSRCNVIKFGRYNQKDLGKRIVNILKNEKIINVDITDEEKATTWEAITHYIKLNYPDMRKTISSIEKNIVDNKLIISQENLETEWENELLDCIMDGNIQKIQTLVNKVSDSEWDSIFNFLYNVLHVIPPFETFDTWKEGIRVISHYMSNITNYSNLKVMGTAFLIDLGDIK